MLGTLGEKDDIGKLHGLWPKQHLSETGIKTAVRVVLASVVHLVGQSSLN